MGQIGIWQIIVIMLISALWIIPFWRIFPRAGLPPALSLATVVPIVGIILLWVLAFKRWPADAG